MNEERENNPLDRLVMSEAVITRKEMEECALTDDYQIPRMLVSKGFKSKKGPLTPVLLGQICYTLDFETGDRKYKQLNA